MDIQGPRRFGYFATRYIKGYDVETVTAQAVALVEEELEATGALLNSAGDPPSVLVSNIEEVGIFNRNKGSGEGFTFYPE